MRKQLQQQMNYFSSDFKLGILGGGQLGKMLLTETRKFDIQTLVLEPSEEAPVTENTTAESRAKNRRVVFRILKN